MKLGKKDIKVLLWMIEIIAFSISSWLVSSITFFEHILNAWDVIITVFFCLTLMPIIYLSVVCFVKLIDQFIAYYYKIQNKYNNLPENSTLPPALAKLISPIPSNWIRDVKRRRRYKYLIYLSDWVWLKIIKTLRRLNIYEYKGRKH